MQSNKQNVQFTPSIAASFYFIIVSLVLTLIDLFNVIVPDIIEFSVITNYNG